MAERHFGRYRKASSNASSMGVEVVKDLPSVAYSWPQRRTRGEEGSHVCLSQLVAEVLAQRIVNLKIPSKSSQALADAA